MKKKDVLKKAIEHYGIDPQLNKAIEELSELIGAICKINRKDGMLSLISEIADVKIMVTQLEMIFGCDKEVKVAMDKKLKRLLKRIEKGE